jgi:hypothetical protein
MRPIPTVLALTLLGLVALPALAQTQTTVVPAVLVTANPNTAFTFRRAADPAAVVDRVLSFDTDGDDRVTAAELPERMQRVVDRVDEDGDGFITAAEVEAGVDRRPTVVPGNAILLRNRAAVTLSDVVHDLKLPQPKHDRALAIVKTYHVPRNLNDSKSVDLATVHAAMKELLDEEEFGDFVAAAARLTVRGNVATAQQLRSIIINQGAGPQVAPVTVR